MSKTTTTAAAKRVRAVHFQRSIKEHMATIHVLTTAKAVDHLIRDAIDKVRRARPDWILDKRTEDAMVRYAQRVHADNVKLSTESNKQRKDSK